MFILKNIYLHCGMLHCGTSGVALTLNSIKVSQRKYGQYSGLCMGCLISHCPICFTFGTFHSFGSEIINKRFLSCFY